MQISDARRISNDLVLLFSASRSQLHEAQSALTHQPGGFGISKGDNNHLNRINKALLVMNLREGVTEHADLPSDTAIAPTEKGTINPEVLALHRGIMESRDLDALLVLRTTIEQSHSGYTFLERDFLLFAIEMRRPNLGRRNVARRSKFLSQSALFLPNVIKMRFTQRQNAVLTIIGCIHKSRNTCDLPLEKIAALAGVSTAEAKNAVIAASPNRLGKNGFLRVEEGDPMGPSSAPLRLRISSQKWQQHLDMIAVSISLPNFDGRDSIVE